MDFPDKYIIYFDDDTTMYKFARFLCRSMNPHDFDIEENEDGILSIS